MTKPSKINLPILPNLKLAAAEPTKAAIAAAAAELFAHRDYESVTIREIARKAGCSHTTIYIYFKDKEALLHHLALGPMQELKEKLTALSQASAHDPDGALRAIGLEFIRFSLDHHAKYSLFLQAKATRVDDDSAASEIQRLRSDWFSILKGAVAASIPAAQPGEQLLAYARSYFFMLHGVVATYVRGPEPTAQVMERLETTFVLAMDALLAGLRTHAALQAPS